jgi:hypothetical protein
MRSLRFLFSSTALMLVSSAFLGAENFPARAQEVQRPLLTAQQCSPLTEANYDLCCVARNRMEILRAKEIDQCPPITTSLIQSVLDEFSQPGERSNGVHRSGTLAAGGIGEPDFTGGDEGGSGAGGIAGEGGGRGDGAIGGGGDDNEGGDPGGGGDGVAGGENGGDGNGVGGDNGGHGHGGGGGNQDHVNSGPGNGGEGAPGEAGDLDPGNSGDHNNAPDTPSGK